MRAVRWKRPKAFYTALFGWAAQVATEPEHGGYMTFQKDGKDVAAAASKMSPEQPEQWSTYVSLDDAGATAAKAAQAGGRILVEPLEIPNSGTMAVLTDPTGAVIGRWQPGPVQGRRAVQLTRLDGLQ